MSLFAFPQTPAKAASSLAPSDHVIKALEEAAPGVEVEDIKRVWIGAGDLVHVVARAEGEWLQFVFSRRGELQWIGAEGDWGKPFPAGSGRIIPFIEIPPEVYLQLLGAGPNIERVSVLEQLGSTPVYTIMGETNGSRIIMRIELDGSLVGFDIDTDWDGLGDAFERSRGWDHEALDTDGDAYPDGVEFDRGTDPMDARRHPEILKVEIDRNTRVLIATIDTFKGASFHLETKSPDSEQWKRLGEAIPGNGQQHEFIVPLQGGQTAALLRAGFTDIGDDAAAGESEVSDSGNRCSVPDSLLGRQLVADGGRRLCFKSKNRGEVIEGHGGGMLITPFAYTFQRSGTCRARLTLTFNTANGFEVAIYRLTFGADGKPSGVFVASEFESGAEEDRYAGNFTLSMNR